MIRDLNKLINKKGNAFTSPSFDNDMRLIGGGFGDLTKREKKLKKRVAQGCPL